MALTQAERHRALVEWNRTEREYPRDGLLHELFRVRARETPDRIALDFGDQQLSYGELQARSDRLARTLRSLGVGPDVPVGLCLERSAAMIVAQLAVLEAGGAYLPLDPSHPPDRLALMLEDAGARLLVTAGEAAAGLGSAPVRVLRLDRELPRSGVPGSGLPGGVPGAGEARSGVPRSGVPAAAVADNLAYIIYTSGSTGRPKGVAVSHRAVLRLVINTDYAPLSAAARIAHASNVSFDAATFEIWGALLHGGRLVGIAPEAALDVHALAAALAARRVSVMFLTTALFNQVVRDVPGAFSGLDHLLFGGEAVDPEPVRQMLAAGGDGGPFGGRLLHVYGPTETTTFATWQHVTGVDPGAATVAIGRPIANTRAYVVDRDLEPVAVGEPGELYLGGDGLARGYFGRPARTARSFVPDPFGDPGSRLYRTGDRVRTRPDGAIEFIGRFDSQVKIRGFRIEPGEVEATLLGHPGVRQAVVLVDEGGGDRRLVAYLVAAAPVAEVRGWLEDRLPTFMVPAAFVTLESMPLNPNGKIDRAALARLEPAARPEGPRTAPRTAMEAVVAGIWEEVLGRDDFGVDDSFFELGGHSLAIARVLTRLRRTVGCELSPADLFEAATVAELARRLEAPGAADRTLPPIEAVPRDRPLPLSLPQERIWFLNELAPGNLAYNAQLTVRFSGPLEAAVLERAVAEVVRRHEILRTTFDAGADGRPVQTVHPWRGATVRVEDLSTLPAAIREREAERQVALEIARPFDVTRLPLVRWTLLRLAPDDHLLVQVEHHFVHDGWSLAVLLGEIKALYEAFAGGRPSPLPEPPIQFGDYAVWQRRWLTGTVLDEQLAYWRRKLGGDPGLLPLPTDFPRPPAPSFKGDMHAFDLPEELYRGLRRMSRQQGVTLFMSTLAAFLVFLERTTGRDQLWVGTGIANRRLKETEGLLGMMINTLPLATRLDGDPPFSELLARVRQTTLEAYAHQDLPFERLVEALRPRRDSSYSPLFQVSFAFHDAAVPDLDFAGLTGRLQYRHNRSSKFDMNVILVPRAEQRTAGTSRAGDALLVLWEYSTDLFSPATIERWAGHYLNLLAAAVEDPERRISELPMLGAAERQQLAAWSAAPEAAPSAGDLVARVAAQAAARPDAPALVAGDETVTYGELEARARRVARHLSALGVGPEVRVGVLLERSPQMVVAALAVLQAGGAYLPLDPTSPPARWAFMLEDAEARVVLTRGDLGRRLPAVRARRVDLDDGLPAVDAESATSVDPPAPESLAYVIYTSGSTGRPKAVAVSHRALGNLIAWHCEAFEPRSGERATQLARVSFDAAVWEVWPNLASGATLCFPDDDILAVPAELRDWLVAEEIDLTFLPTPLAERLLELPWPRETALRLLLTGGDKLRRRPAPGLPFEVVNNYGPTENAVVATSGPVAAAGGKAPSLGRALPGVESHLLDRRLRPAALGVAAELCLGGASLARGYLSRPARTAASFVPHPFSRRTGARLYRTGDLVRFLADGRLEFLGRIDHQVKLRGLRIELGEIEAAVRENPAVRDAVVLLRRPPAGGAPALSAYVIGDATAGELRAVLRRRLPEYMVPAHFVPVDEWPLTAHGKVDRGALERLELPQETAAREDFRPPKTATERALAAVWQEVLTVERAGLDDNFFDLGGHSLLLARVREELRGRLGRQVPIIDLLNFPNLRQLARHLDGSAADLTPRLADQDDRLERGKDRLKRQLLRRRSDAAKR